MTTSVSFSPGPGFVSVVGESHYQDALQRAKRSRPDEEPVFMATLVREPQNAYDANAVAVVIEPFGTVRVHRSRGSTSSPRFLMQPREPLSVAQPNYAADRQQSHRSVWCWTRHWRRVRDSVITIRTTSQTTTASPSPTERKRANEVFVAETKPLEVSTRGGSESAGIEPHCKQRARSRPFDGTRTVS